MKFKTIPYLILSLTVACSPGVAYPHREAATPVHISATRPEVVESVRTPTYPRASRSYKRSYIDPTLTIPRKKVVQKATIAVKAPQRASKPRTHILRPIIPAKKRTVFRTPLRASLNWAALRKCESGGNYAINTGNGFYGAYQFDRSTWRDVGGSGLPSNASRAEQDMRAQMLYNVRGWHPWPVCGKRL